MARSVKRSFGFAAFGAPLVLVLTLAACGGGDDASLGSEVEIKPSSFVTTPSTTTPPTAAPGAQPTGEPGETSPQEQVHVVLPGEFLSGIAADYDVTMDEIIEYNSWSDGTDHQLNPDDQVRIPPGAMIPSPDEEDEEDEESESTEEDSGDSGDETDTTEESDDPELCPSGEPRGTYTIRANDIPARVATALDVTLDQLEEANAGNSAYDSFIVGAKINIPCGAESSETTEG